MKQFNAKPIKEELFPLIEKILGITLWGTVKEALKTGNMNILFTGRRTGRTLAFILLDCFDGRDIVISTHHQQDYIRRHYEKETYRIWNLLNDNCLQVGDLIIKNINQTEIRNKPLWKDCSET